MITANNTVNIGTLDRRDALSALIEREKELILAGRTQIDRNLVEATKVGAWGDLLDRAEEGLKLLRAHLINLDFLHAEYDKAVGELLT